MATAFNIGHGWEESAEPSSEFCVPLEALPFEAAKVDAAGRLSAANTAWADAHPQAGESFLKWCDSLHREAPALRCSLLAGWQSVITRRERRFVQEYSGEDGAFRVTLNSCAGGALVLRQQIGPGEKRLADDWQARKMESVGRLVGGVAHDFANILTLIAGYCHILQNRLPDLDSVRPEIEEIRRAADRGSQLTAQLLGFTRGQTARPRPLDLNILIAEMQRMLRPIIGEYIELQTRLSPNLGKVVADPGQMEQVIMNLILNARDAMPYGGRITISTANSEVDEQTARATGMRGGPCIELTVSDSGHGIEPEAMNRLFEPFFTTKDKGKGTGLGLSTVRSIVNQTSGDITVSSQPGKGAEFSIRLPRAAETGETGESVAAKRNIAPGAETILLVEDEDSVRRLLGFVLRKQGYTVLEAADGEDALQVYSQRRAEIDLVLTDMVMPRMSGRKLAERLFQEDPGLRIVFMSGYTDDVLVRTGALSPGMSVLQKPLRPEVLAARLREALDAPARPFNPR